MANLVTEAELLARYNYFDTASATNNNNDLLYYSEVEVIGRLSTHFDVFTVGHPTVKDLIIDMANAKAGKIKDRADNYKAVTGRIDEIKKGNEFIYTGSGTAIQPSAGDDVVWSTTMDYHPAHTMLDAEDSFVSSDRMENLEDVRDI